jgi:hypothetical protein
MFFDWAYFEIPHHVNVYLLCIATVNLFKALIPPVPSTLTLWYEVVNVWVSMVTVLLFFLFKETRRWKHPEEFPETRTKDPETLKGNPTNQALLDKKGGKPKLAGQIN